MRALLLLVAACAPAPPGGTDPPPTIEELLADPQFDDDQDPEIPGESDALYADGAMPTFELQISDGALAALDAYPREYAPATLRWEGVEYGPIGVRTKGNNSWQPIDAHPSLKLDFNEYVRGGELMGLKKVTLNAMNEDPSKVRERVAYRLYREAGVPAARCNHAWVVVNDADYGLYANVETVHKRMIARWFEDPEGSRYELADVDFRDEYVALFEHDDGPDDRTTIQGVADAFELSDADAAWSAAATHMDMDAFRTYWAVSAYVSHLDGYPYSDPGDDAHIYVDPISGRIHLLPHGLDETFDHPTDWVEHGISGVIADRCIPSDACRDDFRTALWDVVDVADAVDLVGYLDTVVAEIAPLVDEDERAPHDAGEVAARQDDVRDMLVGRRAELASQLD